MKHSIPDRHAPRRLRIAALLLLALGGTAAHAQVAVVASAKSSQGSLTPEQLANLYLGKLPGQLYDLPEGSPLREQFYSKGTGRTTAQVKATWARLTFSGKASPPKEVASSADLKKALAANPDAIGYIEKSAVDPTVKVLLELN